MGKVAGVSIADRLWLIARVAVEADSLHLSWADMVLPELTEC